MIARRNGFSFGNLVAAVLMIGIVYFAAVEFLSDARAVFSAFGGTQVDSSEDIDRQVSILRDAIRIGRVTQISGNGFTLTSVSGEEATIRYDKKSKSILVKDRVLLPNIVSAKFSFFDRTGEKTSEMQDIRTVKVDFTMLVNTMSGIIEKRSIKEEPRW